jgi:hypothetical protein
MWLPDTPDMVDEEQAVPAVFPNGRYKFDVALDGGGNH